MKLRLFIALNLPEDLKKKINYEVNQLRPLFKFPIRFSAKENWHITLTFLGYEPEEAIAGIMAAMKKTAADFKPLTVQFENLSYGPKDTSSVRMIWLNGTKETSRALAALKASLEDNLIDNQVNFKGENRPFETHLTLARFEPQPRRNLTPLAKPFNHQFEAKGLDLMQSHLQRSGAEYELLTKFEFK